MDEIKISIVVPFYNSELYLKRCLDSLLVSVKNMEGVQIILVDDGSEDSSRKICLDYPEFELHSHTENLGVSCARNTGLQVSKGEWVTFLDSDDTILTDGITTLMDAIQTYNNYNIIQFNHERYYAEIDRRVCKYTNTEGEHAVTGDNIDQVQMWYMVWNKLYKKSFLRSNRIQFNESLQFGEDVIFNLKCIKNDNVIYHVEKSVILRYFDNKNSLARSATIEDVVELSSALFEFLLTSRNAENQEFRRIVGSVIRGQWNSDKYQKIIEEDV